MNGDKTDISLVQDDEVGDGTTSVAVLACELLKVCLCVCVCVGVGVCVPC